MQMNKIALSAALKKIRCDNGLSARELSVKSGFPEYTVSRIENCALNPDLITIYGLIKSLGVSMEYFINTAEKMIENENVQKIEELNSARKNLRAARNLLLDKLMA